MAQNALSVVTRIRPDQIAALQAVLAPIGEDPVGNTQIPFPQITTLHFACWVVLDRDPRFAPSLVWESNHDGSADAHLDELVRCAGPGLHAIYSLCEDYPADGLDDPASLKAYLQRHRVPCPAFYVGCYGQSVASVRHALALRVAIERFLDREQAGGRLQGQSQEQIYARIREFAPTLSLDPPYEPRESYDNILSRSKFATGAWILLAVALLLRFPRIVLGALLLFILILRWHEIRDAKGPGPTPPPSTRACSVRKTR